MTDRSGAVLRESRSRLPSVDRLARHALLQDPIACHGRPIVIQAIREVLEAVRAHASGSGSDESVPDAETRLAQQATLHLEQRMRPSLRPVLNLTGTVLHTNLGRAPLPPEAPEAIAAVPRPASKLDLDLERGTRRQRDGPVAGWPTRPTGAPARAVVQNPARAR